MSENRDMRVEFEGPLYPWDSEDRGGRVRVVSYINDCVSQSRRCLMIEIMNRDAMGQPAWVGVPNASMETVARALAAGLCDIERAALFVP